MDNKENEVTIESDLNFEPVEEEVSFVQEPYERISGIISMFKRYKSTEEIAADNGKKVEEIP